MNCDEARVGTLRGGGVSNGGWVGVGIEVVVGVLVSDGIVGDALAGNTLVDRDSVEDATGEAFMVVATMVGDGEGWQAASKIANTNQEMNSREINFMMRKSCPKHTIG